MNGGNNKYIVASSYIMGIRLQKPQAAEEQGEEISQGQGQSVSTFI